MHHASRPRAGAALAYGALLTSALLALPGSVSTAQEISPCTVQGTKGDDVFVVVPYTPAAPGEVATDAIICGGDGNDTLGPLLNSFVTFTGTFYGGPGNDTIRDFNAFNGAFYGGPGDDVMTNLHFGLFEGGPGNDYLSDLVAGLFRAGPGNDVVNIQYGGTYDGAPGVDTVIVLCGGTQVNVEVILTNC